MYNTRKKKTNFHKKREPLHLIDIDLNPPFKHANLVSVRLLVKLPVRLPVRLGKLNKTLINE